MIYATKRLITTKNKFLKSIIKNLKRWPQGCKVVPKGNFWEISSPGLYVIQYERGNETERGQT